MLAHVSNDWQPGRRGPGGAETVAAALDEWRGLSAHRAPLSGASQHECPVFARGGVEGESPCGSPRNDHGAPASARRRNPSTMAAIGRGYFSEESGKGSIIFYSVTTCLVICYCVICVVAPFITPVCDKVAGDHSFRARTGVEYPNPDYQKDPCKFTRYWVLGGMNKWEADMCVRVLVSIVLGSVIGWERRRADRPAGIRTMAMVCMGACVFTIDSVFAFWDGPMAWDSSRVSAAIPSGVGFLGAASIWKGTSQSKEGITAPEVHGLTTATSVWLSAAIGILVGGALYAPATFSTFLGVVYLRFAPR